MQENRFSPLATSVNTSAAKRAVSDGNGVSGIIIRYFNLPAAAFALSTRYKLECVGLTRIPARVKRMTNLIIVVS